MHGDVVALRDHVALGVEQGAGKIRRKLSSCEKEARVITDFISSQIA